MPQVLTISNLEVMHFVKVGGRKQLVHAVRGVTLHVDENEIVGLVGESGSGKTSIALAACGINTVASGTVLSAGQNFSKIKGGQLRKAHADVQMVFQDPFSSLDPRQRIGAGLDELRKLHPDRTKDLTNEELMIKVDLKTEILSRLPSQISGGQAQRVSIVRAIMLRPKLLVADEPTSGLDALVQVQILGLFRTIRRSENLAMLFISHDLTVVRNLCDRVYIMKDGVIVEDDFTEKIFRYPASDYTRHLINAVPGKHLKLAEAQNGPNVVF